MQGHIDIRAGVVRVGDRSWPFDLDLQAGVASLLVGDQQFAVRPLLWREKVALARFAHLGLAFVQRQFLRLSLAGKAAPEDEPLLAALSALAWWVNSPDETHPALPLDPKLMGAVALNLSRAAGLRPADLDERTAVEVELIWQAAVRSDQAPVGSRPAEDDAGQVRVLILPDPPLEPTDAVHSAQRPDSFSQQTARQPGRVASSSGETVTTLSAAQLSELPGEPSAGVQIRPVTFPPSMSGAAPTDSLLPAAPRERQPGQPSQPDPFGAYVPSQPTPPQPRSVAPSPTPARRSGFANRFRVTYPVANHQDSAATIAGSAVEENNTSARPVAHKPPAGLSTPPNDAAAPPALVPIAGHYTYGSMSTDQAESVSPTVANMVGQGLRVEANITALSASPADVERQETPPSIEWGSFLDELNERLEQAAADMGIDMEE